MKNKIKLSVFTLLLLFVSLLGQTVAAQGSGWLNNGSDIYFNTGNVGIGTNTPAYKLTVTDTIASTKTLAPTLANGLENVTNADPKFMLYNNSSTNWSGFGTDEYGNFWLRTGLSSNANEKGLFRIHSNGTIQTGRNLAPGSISSDSISATDSKVLFYNGGGANWSGLGTDSYGNFWLRTGVSSASVFNVKANGNVGVGNTNPGYKLTVNGDVCLGNCP